MCAFWVLYGVLSVVDNFFTMAAWYFGVKLLLMSPILTHIHATNKE